MILASSTVWRGDRVELFVLEPEDVSEAYVGWLNDPRVNRFLESRFEQHTLESTRAFVAGCRQSDKSLLLGIRGPRHAGRHIGNIKVEVNARHGVGEVGLLIGEIQVHGQGIATQAVELTVRIARTQLGLRKLSAGCYATNKGSERAFVKAGFVVEGVRPGHFLLEGRPENLVLLGLML